jgi:hypothetical protein
MTDQLPEAVKTHVLSLIPGRFGDCETAAAVAFIASPEAKRHHGSGLNSRRWNGDVTEEAKSKGPDRLVQRAVHPARLDPCSIEGLHKEAAIGPNKRKRRDRKSGGDQALSRASGKSSNDWVSAVRLATKADQVTAILKRR